MKRRKGIGPMMVPWGIPISCDSDKLCILLQGFVWETYVSDMKIFHKIRSDRFQNVFSA